MRYSSMQYAKEGGTNKKQIKKAIYIFIAMMLFLTLFSKTISNIMLPSVTTTTPREGTLNKEVRATGSVKGKEIHYAYTKEAYTVKEVKVEIGESVSKGQVLMVLDTKDQERELYEEQKILAQKKLDLAKVQTEQKQEAQAKEREIQAKKDQWEQKQKNHARLKSLLEAEAETTANVEAAEAEVREAERAYEKAREEKDNLAQTYSLESQNQVLEIQLQESKIAGLKEELAAASNVVAPRDGIITELNGSQGSQTDPLKPLYALTSKEGGFEVKISIDREKAEDLQPGDEVEISIPAAEEKRSQGKIREILATSAEESSYDENGQKDVLIDIQSQNLRGGERAEIYIEKETQSYEMVIPNEAVRKSSSNSQVLILKESEGAWGKTYYVQEIPIVWEDADDENTAVFKGLTGDETIICSSDKPIADGDRVKVAPEDN